MSAKGRTNVELREQFILAPGVSQSLAPFKAKAGSPSPRSVSVPTAGPITKVRTPVPRGTSAVPRYPSGACLDSVAAAYFMSQLMPIFESIRHNENLPCTYPIKVKRPAAFLRVTRGPIG